MEQHAHPAWVLGLVSVPLTLWTLLAGATVGDPGLVDDTHAAVPLPSTFLGEERLSRWATHGPIWLEGKILSRVAPGFPDSPNDGRFVALRRHLPGCRFVESGTELGSAQRLW